jgi:non-structural maintenance of chromosomes element 4
MATVSKSSAKAATGKKKTSREGSKENQQDGRALRRNLTKLLRDTKEAKHELAADPDKLMGRLEDANSLCATINRATDASLDSEVLTILAKGGLEIAKKAARGSTVKYSLDDYTRRLKHAYGDGTDASNKISWGEYAKKRFSAFFRPVPATTHMLGPMGLAPVLKRKQAATRRARRVVTGDGVRPDEMDELEDVLNGEEGTLKETDRNMETMYRVLGQCPENRALMMELCINHGSFSQTVENIFTLSFLVRDGRVSLHKTDEGIEVRKVTKEQSRAAGEGGAERMQFVMTLSIGEWKTWCGAVRKENALMPDRDGGGEEEKKKKKQRSSAK